MNKFLLFTLIIFLPLVSFAQHKPSQTRFTLNGKITEKNTKVLYLHYIDKMDKEVRDSCIVRNGTFKFTGDVKEVTQATLIGSDNPNLPDYLNSLHFFIDPAIMQIIVTENKFYEARITGSQTQREHDLYRKSLVSNNKALDSVQDLSTFNSGKFLKAKNRKDSAIIESEQDRLKSLFIHFLGIEFKLGYAYIYSHPDSYLSAFYLRSIYPDLSIDSINILYGRLSDRVRNSRDGRFLKEPIRLKNNTSVGKMAPDFSSVDMNGNPLLLSGFRGKNYVLLDFWASWCGPCQALYPHLKMVYQKYHPKGLEIISIKTRDTRNEWLQAIRKNGIEIWKNIPLVKDLNPENMKIPSPDNLSLNYESSPIPILILIDQSGKIIGRWDQNKKENEIALDRKLAELMGY